MKYKKFLRPEEKDNYEGEYPLYKKYRFYGIMKCNFEDLPTDAHEDHVKKEEIQKKEQEELKKMAMLQERLYADKKEGVIVILQAIDAAGKDSTIKHVIGGMNPAGVYVYSFKQPNQEELSHDYMWRIHRCVPERGNIAIFNRSYYEDVITVQIHDLWKDYQMPDRVLDKDKKEFFAQRYEQINHFESYLYQNGYRVVKIFLNVSKEEQKKRILDRLVRKDKNWKFSPGDLKERALWDEYQKTFMEVINKTATKHAPWYVIPADEKWYTRFLATEIIVDALESCHPQFPDADQDIEAHLEEYKRELLDD